MNSGRNASADLIKKLKGPVKVIMLPSNGGKVDPNSFFMSGQSATDFKKLMENSLTPIEFLLSFIPKDIEKIYIRESLEKDIFEYLSFMEELDYTNHFNYTIRHHFDLNLKETDKYIRHFKKHYKSNENNKTHDKKEEKDNVIHTSFLETDLYLIEQILDKRNSAEDAEHAEASNQNIETSLLVYEKETKDIEIVKEFVYEGVTYKPVQDDLLQTGTIQLPSGAEKYGSQNKLVQEIEDFLNSYFEVDPFFQKFLPYMCLYYWVYDVFPFIPYIHFVGRTGTGKTTALEVFGSICYKPIDTSGSITMSPIFRVADKWGGTLLIDEFETAGNRYQELEALLKSGSGNRSVLRTEGDRTKEVKAFKIKAPKILTSENPIVDAGLQSRTIVVQMKKNKRKVPLYRLGSFRRKAEEIRNKLLLWRLHNRNGIDLEKIEYGYKELSAFDGRVQQVITPAYFLTEGDSESRKTILGFAKEQEKETLRRRRDSKNGEIFQAIVDLMKNGEKPTLVNIANTINKPNTPTWEQHSEKRIATIIRQTMGLKVEQIGHDKASTVLLEGSEKELLELGDYYGIELTGSASTASTAEIKDTPLDEIIKEFDGKVA